MNLYADYIKEREGRDSIFTDRGFITFRITDDRCVIHDIYVKPEFRQTNEATKMADIVSEIAKARGCKHLLGTVCPTTAKSTTSLLILIAYGMTLLSSKDNLIYFSKEIG